jgi:hypothetical protein
MQRRGVVSPKVRLDDNLYVVIERNEKAQQSFHRELTKLSAQHV